MVVDYVNGFYRVSSGVMDLGTFGVEEIDSLVSRIATKSELDTGENVLENIHLEALLRARVISEEKYCKVGNIHHTTGASIIGPSDEIYTAINSENQVDPRMNTICAEQPAFSDVYKFEDLHKAKGGVAWRNLNGTPEQGRRSGVIAPCLSCLGLYEQYGHPDIVVERKKDQKIVLASSAHFNRLKYRVS